MPKTVKKPQPFPNVPLPFDKFVGGLLKVDPKKLPGKGKRTIRAGKRGREK